MKADIENTKVRIDITIYKYRLSLRQSGLHLWRRTKQFIMRNIFKYHNIIPPPPKENPYNCIWLDTLKEIVFNVIECSAGFNLKINPLPLAALSNPSAADDF